MSEPAPLSPRVLSLVGVAIVAIAAVGFLFGTAEPSPRRIAPVVAVPGVASATAPSYAQLRAMRRGPNGELYASGLAPLEQAAAAPVNERVRELARDARRAYEGAPPTIPHALDQALYPECLACHARGVTIDGRRAPKMSHPLRESCTQCHVPAQPGAAPLAPSTFVGLRGRSARLVGGNEKGAIR